MFNMPNIGTTAITAAVTALAMASPSLSQETNMTDAQASNAEAPEQFELTDERVTAFIEAARQINGVVESIGPQIEAAETDEARQQFQMQAQTQMAEIVTGSGLSVDQYNSIANAAQTNEGIANRIRETAEAMAVQQ
jgi:uncharacterized protein DUF4168